eukprot:s2655_g12.t1
MHRRLEDGGRGSAMSCVENDLYFDWSGRPGHVQSWTPLPKPAHFHFAVPTSHQQLLFSSVCHSAVARPSAFKASAFVSSVAVLSSLASSSHTAEGPPSLVDAGHCSSQKLQLAKAQEPSMPEAQARRETSKAQHRLAVGSSRTVSHAAQRRDDIRQLVYFEEVGVNLRVGILMDDD